MKSDRIYIIDFDSTFIQLEALDELAKIALSDNPDQEAVTQKIAAITKQGMEGTITFPQSLQKRLGLFKPTRRHIETLIKHLEHHITPSVARNADFFRAHAQSIYIISGGFTDYILPIVRQFGIPADHVLANTFTYNAKGLVTGYDKNNFLSQENGKTKQIKALKLTGTVIVIGDGYTDYEIKKNGAADRFYAFVENVHRETVVSGADAVIRNFDELLFTLELPRALSYPKSKMKVLLLENIHKKAQDYFEQDGYHVEHLEGALDEPMLAEKIQDISILGIRSKTKITPKIIKAAKKLLGIGAFCIGTNQIDLTAAANAGIAVFNAPYSNTRSVVELMIGEIIMLSRRTFDKSMKLHQGVWNKSAKGCHEIRGKTLGIVGYGNIGSQLSVVAENLGMRVIFYDIVDKLAYGNAKKCRTFEELLQESDIVSIHVDGRPANANLVSTREFALMKDDVLFLNASRGFIVDLDALAAHIKSGKIAGAAVDVFKNEPKSNGESFTNVLQNLPNVILTPHIGAGTEEAQENIADFVSERLMRFIDKGETTLSVNFPNLELPALGQVHRLIHIHRNVPGILAQINTIFADNKINIEGQYLKTNENIGYVITDVSASYEPEIIKKLKNIQDTIRVRVLY